MATVSSQPSIGPLLREWRERRRRRSRVGERHQAKAGRSLLLHPDGVREVGQRVLALSYMGDYNRIVAALRDLPHEQREPSPGGFEPYVAYEPVPACIRP